MRHYGIVGPGAMGLLWAAGLSFHQPVTVTGREGHPMDLRFTLVRDSQPAVAVWLTPAGTSPPSILLLTTKSPDALVALEQALILWPDTEAVVLFQNGLGSQQSILARFPSRPVLAAVTTEAANRPASDRVVHAGRGQTRVGGLNVQGRAWATDIAADFARAGFDTVAESHIEDALWDKLVVNAGINAFTVLLDVPNGALPGAPLFERYLGDLCQELAQVSTAAGHPRDAAAVEARIRQVALATAANISSMLQDARSGRITEIDFINGAVVEAGRRHGIATPVNHMLWQQVRARSNHTRSEH